MKKLLLFAFLLVLMAGFATSIWATMMNEGFEGSTFPPENWASAPTSWEIFGTPGYSHTGNQAVKSGYSPSGNWWLITPGLRPEAGANALTFWYRDYSASTGWDYEDEYTYVMISTTGYAPADFTTTLWTGSYSDFTLDYQQASIDLSGYNGMDIYIAFKSVHTGGNYHIIDDVTGINFSTAAQPPLPSSLIYPTMDATGVALNSALSWNIASGSPTNYKVYFGTVNPPVTLVNNSAATTWTPSALLTDNTEYWWQVVPYNAIGDALSCPVWHFTTGIGIAVNISNGSMTLDAGSTVYFYDTGGASNNYGDNQDLTFTFIPNSGHHIVANFSVFNIETDWEFLEVYNGLNPSAPKIGTYTGPNGLLGEIVATGAMTFHFTSDDSVNKLGWAATISDVAPPVDVPAGVDTPVNGITVNSTIDLNIDDTVTLSNPILLALPTFNPAGSTVMSFDGTGLGNLTVNVPDGIWYVGVYDGTWQWSVPNPFNGAGIYTFVGINYGAKADAIVLLTPVDPTLPVELSSFTAILTAEYFVNLTWVTESESGVLGFNVYRSNDTEIDNAVRVNVSTIGAVNTSEQHTYSVTDNEVETNTTYYYWLENVDINGMSNMYGPKSILVTGSSTPDLPTETMLNNAYPNPFYAGTSANIKVSIKAGESGTVTIFNIHGQTVKTFKVNQGLHTLKWDGKGCGSGVYFYKLATLSTNITRKLLIVK